MKTKNIKRHFLSGDGEYMLLVNYLSEEKGAKISKALNEKKYKINDTNQSYRIINHWCSSGLISDNRDEEGKGWRKFSLVDLVWIQIIGELRKFGFSLGKIQETKDCLLASIVKDSLTSELEFYIARILNFKEDVQILIFHEGEAKPLTKDFIELNESITGLDESYISINLNTIMNKLFKSNKFSPKEISLKLSKAETEILENVRNGDFKSLKISFKDGKINIIEKEEILNNQERIIDILKKGKYQDIEIKQQDGKVTSIKSILKEKPE